MLPANGLKLGPRKSQGIRARFGSPRIILATESNTRATGIAFMQTLSVQAVRRWLAALTQGEQANPAESAIPRPSGP